MAFSLYSPNATTFNFGNVLPNKVLFDAAHQKDFETSLGLTAVNRNEYIPVLTEDPMRETTLNVLPSELIVKIFNLAIKNDLATQYTLHYVISTNNSLSRHAHNLIFDHGNEQTLGLNGQLMESRIAL